MPASNQGNLEPKGFGLLPRIVRIAWREVVSAAMRRELRKYLPK